MAPMKGRSVVRQGGGYRRGAAPETPTRRSQPAAAGYRPRSRPRGGQPDSAAVPAGRPRRRRGAHWTGRLGGRRGSKPTRSADSRRVVSRRLPVCDGQPRRPAVAARTAAAVGVTGGSAIAAAAAVATQGRRHSRNCRLWRWRRRQRRPRRRRCICQRRRRRWCRRRRQHDGRAAFRPTRGKKRAR